MSYAIKRILLATDMQPGATEACRHTLGLATALGAKVHVLHVVSPLIAGGEGLASSDTRDEAEVERAIADRVADARAGWRALPGPGVPVEVHVAEGVAFEVILAEAERVGADMIVLGTHKRGLLRRLFEGSVAKRVAFDASVPVLLVPVGRDDEAS